MMVHPDRAVNSHLNWGEMIEEEFKDWAEDISKYGSKFLQENIKRLRIAYENLYDSGNNKDISSFDALIENIPGIIQLTKITTLNADSSNENSRKK